METGVSVTVGFCLGLALAMSFPVCHVLINTIHDSNPRSGPVLKQRFAWNLNSVSVFMMTNFTVQDWAVSRILANPSSHTSLLFTARDSVVLGIDVASHFLRSVNDLHAVQCRTVSRISIAVFRFVWWLSLLRFGGLCAPCWFDFVSVHDADCELFHL